MTKDKPSKNVSIKIRLTKAEDEKLTLYADQHGTSKSQVLRDYIRRLSIKEKPKVVELANGIKVNRAFNTTTKAEIPTSYED